MKRTIIAIALTSILAACGGGGSEAPVTGGQQAQVPAEVQPEPLIKVDDHDEHIDPVSNIGGLPFDEPKTEETPIEDWEAKFLNMGTARAVMEYKMVGEALKTELAVGMGAGVDAWVKQDTERCIADQQDTFRNDIPEHNRAQARLMCLGQAYGYWALVNGTAGTEGSPRQCLEKGYCGFMFKQYDLSPSEVPFSLQTNGLDSEF